MYSNHAVKRMQQRGITHRMAGVLFTFGSEQADHHGATIIYLSKSDLRKVKYLESDDVYRCLSEKPIYAVEKDGLIITIGHRYKKIRRN